jgi:hypothetical protein
LGIVVVVVVVVAIDDLFTARVSGALFLAAALAH